MPRGRFQDDGGLELRNLLGRTNIMAVYERVAKQSSNGIKTRRGILVKCPTGSHKDGSPSCSLNPTKNTFHSFCCAVPGKPSNGGGILDLVVFAGAAKTRGEAVTWLKESGLVGLDFDYRSSSPVIVEDSGAKPGKYKMPPEAKLAVTHLYPDEDGYVRYTVERWEWPNPDFGKKPNAKLMKKRFRQYHAQQPCDTGDICSVCTAMLREDLNDLGGREDAPWKSLAFRYKVPVAELQRMAKDASMAMVRAHPGEMRLGTDGCERIPYNLPSVIEAAKAGRTIFWPEGEKCADSLAALGVTTTTNMGGSNFPIPPSWLRYFKGAQAVVFPADCDAAGRTAARLRAKMFNDAGIPGVALDIDPTQLDTKYDIANWREEMDRAGISHAEQLQRLRETFRVALREQRIAQVLVVNAPGKSPKDPATCHYVHANAAEVDGLLEQTAFAAALLGPVPTAEMKPLVSKLMDRDIRVLVFDDGSPLARATIAFRDAQRKKLQSLQLSAKVG
jgi:hypothetical protein